MEASGDGLLTRLPRTMHVFQYFRDKLFVAPKLLKEVVIICISEKTRCQVSIIGELIFGTRFNRNRYNIAKLTFFNFCSLKAKAGTTTECD